MSDRNTLEAHGSSLAAKLPEQSNAVAGGDTLFLDIASIIERRKANAVNTANAEIVLMFWEVGRHINTALLGTNFILINDLGEFTHPLQPGKVESGRVSNPPLRQDGRSEDEFSSFCAKGAQRP